MTATENRTRALTALVSLSEPVRDSAEVLKAFAWDSEEVLVWLSRRHVIEVLDRYRRGDLTSAEVEQWANEIESRDDIGLEVEFEDLLKDAVFALANPSLTEAMTIATADSWLSRLRADPRP